LPIGGKDEEKQLDSSLSLPAWPIVILLSKATPSSPHSGQKNQGFLSSIAHFDRNILETISKTKQYFLLDCHVHKADSILEF